MTTRTYSELVSLSSFEERFEYLVLNGSVGASTFGFDRYINQAFYRSSEWKHVRNIVILRDNGRDLGVPGYEINVGVLIHHINPIAPEHLMGHEEWVLNPDYLITTTHNTHNAIHYGNRSLLTPRYAERIPGDTKLWSTKRRF